ncbi:unnamed protein product [Owenia fusiformis]|uniref:G-protein coupled receptors family 1 profile domain-containing protein n=1 Tax=Owenia fusiformis TaxID=6347 RepID=A0A8S4NA51_OWEFU|nr:unnamed protein product [Owenia fusiformis]
MVIIIAVVFTKRLRNPRNFVAVSLSLSNIALGILVSVQILVKRPQTSSGCLLAHSTLLIFAYFHVNCILMMTLERYTAVIHPFFYRKWVTKKMFAVVILTSVIICVIFGAYPVIKLSIIESRGSAGSSHLMSCNLGEVSPVIYAVFMTCVGLLALALITGMNVRLLLVARVHIEKMTSILKATGRKDSVEVASMTKQKTKTTLIISFMVVYYTISWTPVHIVLLLSYLNVTSNQLSLLIVFTIAFSSLVISSIIYGIVYKEYRTAFLGLFCKRSDSSQAGVEINVLSRY